MTKVHLDTCFLIRALVPGSTEDQTLRAWLRNRVKISIGTIAWAEFLCGPLTEGDCVLARRLVGPPLPFAETDAAAAARLFNTSGRKQSTFMDCLIAASAMRDGAALATTNQDDFQRFVGAGLSLGELTLHALAGEDAGS